MPIVLYILLSLIVGALLRPAISKFLKKNFIFGEENKRFEIEFRIEYYSQPSIYHPGEEGILVKTSPIKAQIDAADQEEALDVLSEIIRNEVKSELVYIREIPKV